MAWFSSWCAWTKDSEARIQQAAPSCVAVAGGQSPGCYEFEKQYKKHTEVGLHIYFVSSFVIFGAARTCFSVHPSLNCE